VCTVQGSIQHGGAPFHHSVFVIKQNIRFWASENPHRVMETSIHLAE